MLNSLFIFLMVTGAGTHAYAAPVVSKPIHVDGYTVFRDSHDQNLLHVAPSSFAIRRDEMGPRLSLETREDGSVRMKIEVVPTWSFDQEAALRMRVSPFTNLAKLAAELEPVENTAPLLERVSCPVRPSADTPRFCELSIAKDYVSSARKFIKLGLPEIKGVHAIVRGVNEAGEPSEASVEVRLDPFGEGLTWAE